MQEKLLIQQAQSGITTSFSELVILHQRRLYQYLLARCHNSYDADDVLQDTFISAFKYLKSYNSRWCFSTWLFTIANRLIRKQNKFSNQYADLSIVEQKIELEEMSIDPNNIWIHVKKVLKSEAYDVIWFFYVEGFTIKEIAEILQRSNSWVKILLFRSKKKLSKNAAMKVLSKDYFMQGIIL